MGNQQSGDVRHALPAHALPAHITSEMAHHAPSVRQYDGHNRSPRHLSGGDNKSSHPIPLPNRNIIDDDNLSSSLGSYIPYGSSGSGSGRRYSGEANGGRRYSGDSTIYGTPPIINVKSKSRRNSLEYIFSGRRSRTISEQGMEPVQEQMATPPPPPSSPPPPPSPPTVPASEKYYPQDEEAIQPRVRAATLAAMPENRTKRTTKAMHSVVFRWTGRQRLESGPSSSEVYLAGSMTGWKSVPMSRAEGETYYVAIIDAREGTHYYKFCVNGDWVTDNNYPIIKNQVNKAWNTIECRKSDFEVFEALACDSFSLKNSQAAIEENRIKSDSWCQVAPDFDKLDGKVKNPPGLPPHLLQVILNKDVSFLADPVLLAEPSHVMLNHLYAQAIRDGMLVVSSTSRFRKKYVTTILYKPI